MAVPWKRREPVSGYEAALQMCALFAQACKAQGDAENYFRWKNILWQYGPRGAVYGSEDPFKV